MEEDTGILSHENTAWLEKEVLHGLRLWYKVELASALSWTAKFEIDFSLIGTLSESWCLVFSVS